MKKLTILIALTAIFSTTFGQTNSISFATQNGSSASNLRKKARHQKTAAWICVGGGAIMITAGAAMVSTSVMEDVVTQLFFAPPPSHDNGGATALMIVGGGAMIASIPLFISAANNKHKAKMMITEQVTAPGLPIVVAKKIPSLTLAISL